MKRLIAHHDLDIGFATKRAWLLSNGGCGRSFLRLRLEKVSPASLQRLVAVTVVGLLLIHNVLLFGGAVQVRSRPVATVIGHEIQCRHLFVVFFLVLVLWCACSLLVCGNERIVPFVVERGTNLPAHPSRSIENVVRPSTLVRSPWFDAQSERRLALHLISQPMIVS